MAADGSKPKPNPIVGKIVKDPKSPPNALCLRGFVGDSSEDKSIRLYFNPDFSDYVDIPDDAVLHSEPVPEAWSPFGAMYVWIERDAELMHGSERIKANFMQGRIFQQQQAGAQQAAAAQAQPQAAPFPGGVPGGPGGNQFTPPPTPPFVCPNTFFAGCPPTPPQLCPNTFFAACPPTPPQFCPPTPFPQFCPPTPLQNCPPTPPQLCPQTPPQFCPPTPPAPLCQISPLPVCIAQTPACQPITPNCPDTTLCPQTLACPQPTLFNCGPLPFGQGPVAQPQPILAQPMVDPRLGLMAQVQPQAAAVQPGIQQGAVIDQQAQPLRSIVINCQSPPIVGCPPPNSPPLFFCPPPLSPQIPCTFTPPCRVTGVWPFC